MAVSSPAFVGRSEQLDALVAALDRAEAGEAAAVFIGGEAGVGKTRLVAEFERIARARGARVLAGGCVDAGGSELPYARLLGPLRMLVRELEPGRLEKLVGAGARSTGRLLAELQTGGIRSESVDLLGADAPVRTCRWPRTRDAGTGAVSLRSGDSSRRIGSRPALRPDRAAPGRSGNHGARAGALRPRAAAGG
jgi:hypothetical protein